jgi:hypothetical protein
LQRTDADWQRIVDALNGLAKGDTFDTVMARAGPPDLSQTIASGDLFPRRVGTSVMYCRQQTESGISHATDQMVELFFDENDQLKWMIPHRAEGVQRIERVRSK